MHKLFQFFNKLPCLIIVFHFFHIYQLVHLHHQLIYNIDCPFRIIFHFITTILMVLVFLFYVYICINMPCTFCGWICILLYIYTYTHASISFFTKLCTLLLYVQFINCGCIRCSKFFLLPMIGLIHSFIGPIAQNKTKFSKICGTPHVKVANFNYSF